MYVYVLASLLMTACNILILQKGRDQFALWKFIVVTQSLTLMCQNNNL